MEKANPIRGHQFFCVFLGLPKKQSRRTQLWNQGSPPVPPVRELILYISGSVRFDFATAGFRAVSGLRGSVPGSRFGSRTFLQIDGLVAMLIFVDFVFFYGWFINFWLRFFWYRIMMIMVMIMLCCALFSCYWHFRLLLSLHTAKPIMCAEGLLFRSCSVKGACLEFRHVVVVVMIPSASISHIPLHRVSYY